MERIFPKHMNPKQVSLLEAAQLDQCGEEITVLRRNEEDGRWDEQTLAEFVEDCLFFVER